MIHHLDPYPAYRDAGVPWLEKVPGTWKVLRAENVYQVLDVRSQTGEEELLTVSAKDGVVPRREKTVTMFKAESYVGHKLCWPGDLVINSLWAWMQGLGVANHHGIISSAYSVYRPRSAYREYSRYFHYALRSAAYKWELQTRSKGVWLSRLQLSDPAFLDMPLLVPPPDEQAAIVRFLDHADRLIRRYIRAKQKLIKLLEEQKQAIIHRAVTRGLDPDVRLKPSGVEWLGEVPEPWTVVPLKFLSNRIVNGATPPTLEETYYVDGTIPWYGPSSVGRELKVDAPVRHLSEAAFASGRARRITGPALLVVVIGATAGRVGLLTAQGSSNQQITAYELRKHEVVPEFVALQVRLAQSWLRSTASTATIPILNSGTVSRLPVALPPHGEQQRILNAVVADSRPLDAALLCARQESDLLREYRTRLIADVVTGKLDVRAAAASLPSEETTDAEMLEPDDELPEDEEVAADELGAELEEVEV